MQATDQYPAFLTDEDYALLRRAKCAELTDDQFLMFKHAIERFRLDPFGNQIYFQLRFDKRKQANTMSIQTGIDGYRLIADRTGQYAGNDDPVYDSEDRQPNKATVTVYKIVGGQRCPFTASARWDQYFPGEVQGMMWKRMPHLMLGKCAEALALRKAFPAELSGLYTTEEMQQADRDAKTSPLPASSVPHPAAGGASMDDILGSRSTPVNTVNHVGPVDDQTPPEPDERAATEAHDVLADWEPVIAACNSVKDGPSSCAEFRAKMLPEVPEAHRPAVLKMLLARQIELETSVVGCSKIKQECPALAELADKRISAIKASRHAQPVGA